MAVENVKVRIDIDEIWPIYSLVEPDSDHGVIVEIPEGLFNEYQLASNEFERVQQLLNRIYEDVKSQEP